MVDVKSALIWLAATKAFLYLLANKPFALGLPRFGVDVPRVIRARTSFDCLGGRRSTPFCSSPPHLTSLPL